MRFARRRGRAVCRRSFQLAGLPGPTYTPVEAYQRRLSPVGRGRTNYPDQQYLNT